MAINIITFMPHFITPLLMLIIIPPLQQSWKGGILVSRRLSVCPSVCLSFHLSVCLWIESCPLCNFHNTAWIHFIIAHLNKQLSKVCCVKSCWQNSIIWIFAILFLNLLLWLWLLLTWDLIWINYMGNHGAAGVFLKHRHSSCYSYFKLHFHQCSLSTRQ